MKKILVVFGIAILAILPSCATGVQRVDAGTQTDLSGYWNDTDVKIVCESLIKSALNSPRVDNAIKAKGGVPKVIVGRFKNESSEHINTSIISSMMEIAIFNSGKLDFVAGGAERDALREERQDQLTHASDDTQASVTKEIGADFMLTGTVRAIVERAENQTVRTYFVNAEMSDIETGERIWMDQNSEIKKIIVKPKVRL